ncbi:rhomboid family intramembrane serine protease [bacterium]|nr:rhomboid family intramembrane serine protease [bacterium]MBU1874909.1 rhomboid family intramembrane serine protease [bacterium]
MFIPLKDSSFRLSPPYITFAIILINVCVFIYQSTLSPEALKSWIYSGGVVANQLFNNGFPGFVKPFISSLFIHSGFLHLAGNMLYLWIFGDNIESTLGHGKFILFYICAGIIATLCQIIIQPQADTPIIGASGAISGILGAYLIRYPRARIQIFIWLILIIKRVWVPAAYVLGFWFLLQICNGLGALTFQQPGGVAWFAHIGGFLAGIALLFTLEPYERKRVWKQLNRKY